MNNTDVLYTLRHIENYKETIKSYLYEYYVSKDKKHLDVIKSIQKAIDSLEEKLNNLAKEKSNE